MFQWILSLLSTPLLGSIVNAYKAKLDAGNNADKIAADLAGQELLVEAREVDAQNALKVAEIGRWYEPDHLFGYIMVFYIGKIAIWDASFHLGTTDALKGSVGVWAGWIMVFYVGTRGVVSMARILKR